MAHKCWLTAVLLLSLQQPVSAEAGTAAYCADRWGADYVMRESCQTEQAIHAYTMDVLVEQFANDPGFKEILGLCLRRWREDRFDTYDWVMVSSCFDDQSAAYKRLNKLP